MLIDGIRSYLSESGALWTSFYRHTNGPSDRGVLEVFVHEGVRILIPDRFRSLRAESAKLQAIQLNQRKRVDLGRSNILSCWRPWLSM